MAVEFGCSPTTWGVDFADNPNNPAWASVLDDIAAAGCTWLELGPVGYLPTDCDELRAALADRQLRTVGTFVFQPLWDPTAATRVRTAVDRTCRTIAEQGGEVLVVVDQVNPTRNGTAGRSDAAERLPSAAWDDYMQRIDAVAELTRLWGLRPVLHPHAGTYIEFSDEIDRAFADLASIGVCIDTGHLTFAGVDPVATILKYSSRLQHVHLKDVDANICSHAINEELSFWEAINRGVFCPVGQGKVDFSSVLRTLNGIGFEGIAIIEQDRNPSSPSRPRDDLDSSLTYLRAL